MESRFSNTRYAIGDGDGGEGGATSKSTISNARYAVRDGDSLFFAGAGNESRFIFVI